MYKEKRSELVSIFREMPSADEILRILEDIELDINEFYSTYGKEKINDAVRYAKDLKDRFSALWTYYDIFGKEDIL